MMIVILDDLKVCLFIHRFTYECHLIFGQLAIDGFFMFYMIEREREKTKNSFTLYTRNSRWIIFIFIFIMLVWFSL